MQPIIVLQFRDENTLKLLPSIYIKTFEEAIKVLPDDDVEGLEELKRWAIGIRAEIDAKIAAKWVKDNDFISTRQEGLYE